MLDHHRYIYIGGDFTISMRKVRYECGVENEVRELEIIFFIAEVQ